MPPGFQAVVTASLKTRLAEIEKPSNHCRLLHVIVGTGIALLSPMETPSTRPYCGVGCGVLIKTEAGRITGVRGDPNHPANFGRLCSNGATLHLSTTK